LLHLVETTTNQGNKDVTRFAEMLPALTVTASSSTFSKKEGPIMTSKKLHTTLSLSHYAEDIGEAHVGCLEPNSNDSVYSHNQIYGSGPHLTSVMCSLCHNCYSLSP
jgi:hypothetical protein